MGKESSKKLVPNLILSHSQTDSCYGIIFGHEKNRWSLVQGWMSWLLYCYRWWSNASEPLKGFDWRGCLMVRLAEECDDGSWRIWKGGIIKPWMIVNYTFGLVLHTKNSYSKVQEPFNEEEKSPVQEFNLYHALGVGFLEGMIWYFTSLEKNVSCVLYISWHAVYCYKRYQTVLFFLPGHGFRVVKVDNISQTYTRQ